MGINRVTKRGEQRIEVRKRWPDGTTFRRYYPNKAKAKETLTRIEASLLDGTWPELKETLRGSGHSRDLTVSEFSDIYFQRYCCHFNRRPDFKEQALSKIVEVVGQVPLKQFSAFHGDVFVSKRSKKVAPATINRGLAVLKHMLNFAVKRGYLESNPLSGFERLPEEEVALRIMTLEEERRLVSCIRECSPIIGAYAAILGETGLRKSEGLGMQWQHIDWQTKRLTVPKSKTGKPRYIPLSEDALEWLTTLVRYTSSPWVFTRPNGKPLKAPREGFYNGRRLAGLDWVRGFHDFRHFRATQWLLHGVDIYTVKSYLGHSRIETTQRYLHFVPSHAEHVVRAAQAAERKELGGRHVGDSRNSTVEARIAACR